MTLQMLTTSSEPTLLTLALEGQLNALTSPELERFVTDLDVQVKTLILDLNRLSFVSSAGLRVFAKARKAMQAREGKLCFVRLSPQVKRVFDIIKVVPPATIFQDEQELDSYLAHMQDQPYEDE
jgi:anti-anti-sigma factor